jgi:hypothetical protein
MRRISCFLQKHLCLNYLVSLQKAGFQPNEATVDMAKYPGLFSS